MILIVSHPGNEHVEDVMTHITRDTAVVDTGSFPASLGLSVAMSCEREDLQFELPGGRRIRLCQVGSVWYRRISPYGFHEELRDPTARLFAWSEANEALLGVWYSIGAWWMNPPLADEVSQRKIRQLQAAKQLGLTIPDTLVTNEPDVAQVFVQKHGIGHVVRKAFRNIIEAPRETHLLRAEDLAQLDSVCYTPVIFQEYVPATLDLRVTIVEDDVFAASVASESQFAADYRPGLASATVRPYDLPIDVSTKLRALMNVFALNYGAFDLRVTPGGDHVFLEVNPGGEYLFISRRTGQPISAAIAAALERRDKSRRGAPC
jgi:glutathione synthase/RimK-type ligase-like ATP-grasp enzyme